MHVAFEVSDLYPDHGGLYTYASQLLWRLRELADPPRLTLLDGTGRNGPGKLLAANDDRLPSSHHMQARALPLLHVTKGPWDRSYVTRRVAWRIDRHVMIPLSRRLVQVADSHPWLARYRLPGGGACFDVCHWPFEAMFIPATGTTHVATIHDTTMLRHPEWHTPEYVRQHTATLRLIARYATRIVTDSDNTRQDVIKALGVSPERIDTVPLAAGPEFYLPAEPMAIQRTLAHHGLLEGDYVLFVGILSERKNLVRLATAFKAALERTPELATRLVLAGKPSEKADTVYRGLNELGLGERLALLGRVAQEDLPHLLAGARAVAYVSLDEGFGLPPLEAMACGTPVVASNTTSIPEVVGDAGLLVDPYDVAAIAEALHRLMTDDGLRADLVARGRQRAAHFSWHRTAQLTMQTYQRAIEDKRATRDRGRRRA